MLVLSQKWDTLPSISYCLARAGNVPVQRSQNQQMHISFARFTVSRAFTMRFLMSAIVLAVASIPASGLDAQRPAVGDRVTVLRGTALRGSAGGPVIGVSSRAVTARVDLVEGGFVRVTMSGHLSSSHVKFSGDRSRAEVSRAQGSSLRASGSGSAAVVAELREGTYVYPERAGGKFAAVRPPAFFPARRSLWVDISRIEGQAAINNRNVATTPPSQPTAVPETPVTKPPVETPAPAPLRSEPVAVEEPDMRTRVEATLRQAPGGGRVGEIASSTPLVTLARARGWVKVRVEGWIPDSTISASQEAGSALLSAADLRSDPEGNRGRLVEWRIEFLAFQTADSVRKGLSAGEHYLLSRGPGQERAVLYLALPDSLRERAMALTPLTELNIIARVRDGRSQPSGVPVLDLLEFSRPR